MSERVGLIVGVGSIGRRHAAVMAERYEQLIVVDTQATALEWCHQHLKPEIRSFDSVEAAIPEITSHTSDITAVIAAWGPHQFPIFSALVDAGVRNIFCEKPVAVSLGQVAALREMIRSNGISLNTGLHFRYRNIAETIRAFADKYLGGAPSMCVVAGGARCVATNGIHWLDLASCTFGCEPISVTSRLQRHEINPRTPSVGFWQGVGVWEYPQGRVFTVSYSNHSSVDDVVTWFCPLGTIRVTPSLEIVMEVRDRNEVETDARMTRVGATKPMFPTIAANIVQGSVLAQQLDDVESGNPIPFADISPLRTVEALLAAFESNNCQKSLSLPVSNDVLQSSDEWAIS